jgi:hypothetical protein
MTPLREPVAMSLAPLRGNACLLSIPRETGPARRFFSAILVKPFYLGATVSGAGESAPPKSDERLAATEEMTVPSISLPEFGATLPLPMG